MINREKYLNELFSKYSGFWNAGALVLDQLNENYAVKGILGYSMVADEVANNQAKVYDKEEGGIDDVEFQKIYEQYYNSALEVKPFVIEAFILSNLCQDEIQENTLKAIKNFSNKEKIYTEELYEYLDKLEKQESFMQDMVWNNASFDWDSFSQREINVLMNNEHTIHSFFEKNSNRIEDEWKRIGIAVEETLKLFTPQTREELLKLVKNLSINLGDIDTSKITDMSGLFRGTQRTDFSGIEKWDVSKVEDMNNMFRRAESFNADISNWDVGNVRDMGCMFSEATSFNQPIGKWNVGNVENMSCMFDGATSFNQPIGDWNVSNVENMYAMFYCARAFNQDISGWDVRKVVDMSWMFSRAESFNQPIGEWNVSKVEEMDSMFCGAISFNQDLSSWDISGVENIDDETKELIRNNHNNVRRM